MNMAMKPTIISPPVGPMMLNTPVGTPSSPPIEGDPATRRFGMVFFLVLVAATIGAMVGIGVGNIAHYRYFGPTNTAYTAATITAATSSEDNGTPTTSGADNSTTTTSGADNSTPTTSGADNSTTTTSGADNSTNTTNNTDNSFAEISSRQLFPLRGILLLKRYLFSMKNSEKTDSSSFDVEYE